MERLQENATTNNLNTCFLLYTDTPIMNEIAETNVRNICKKLFNHTTGTNYHFGILKLHIQDEDLKEIYLPRIEAHNNQALNERFPDSGFDLIVPDDVMFDKPFETTMIDFKVKAEMLYYIVDREHFMNSAFCLYPRSSICKEPLMLANHTGVIDSGYRGNIKGAFRWFKTGAANNYFVEHGSRLVQICHPTLCPIYVITMDENELASTTRGDKGFGSTGKKA